MSVNLNDTLHKDGLSSLETVDLNKMLDHKEDQKLSGKKTFDANEVATKLVGQINDTDSLQQTNKLEKMNLISSVFDLVTDFFGSKNRDKELEKLKLKHQAIKTSVTDLNSSIKNLASDQHLTNTKQVLSSKQNENANTPDRKTDFRSPKSSVNQYKGDVKNESMEDVDTETVLDKAPVIQSTIQTKSAAAENEMIDQRAMLIANQQTIEENISKLKLQGEK